MPLPRLQPLQPQQRSDTPWVAAGRFDIWPAYSYWDCVAQDASTAARRESEVARRTARFLASREKNLIAAALADVESGTKFYEKKLHARGSGGSIASITEVLAV